MQKQIRILDGGMGTMLQRQGLQPGDIPELLCFTDPHRITDIHRAYVQAGADLIYTNTFGGNRFKLRDTGHSVEELAMVAVEKRLKKELPEAKLVLQVHDELIVECPEPQAEAAAKLLEEEMEQVAHLSVPLTAEAHWGRNWLEAKG